MNWLLIIVILILAAVSWWRNGTLRRERERLQVEHSSIIKRIQNDPDNDAALEALGDWYVRNKHLQEAIGAYHKAIESIQKHGSDVSGDSRVAAKIRSIQYDIDYEANHRRGSKKPPKIRDVDLCPTCGASNMLGAEVCDTCGQLMLTDTIWQSLQNMWNHRESRKALYETAAIITIITALIAVFDWIPPDIKGPLLASAIVVIGYRFLWSLNGGRI